MTDHLDLISTIDDYPQEVRDAIKATPRPAEVARKLIDHVNGLGERNWYQTLYAFHEPPSIGTIEGGRGALAVQPCGTSCCVAGETVMMVEGASLSDHTSIFRIKGVIVSPANVASAVLGQQRPKADQLFLGSNTRGTVIARLERIIADDPEPLWAQDV